MIALSLALLAAAPPAPADTIRTGEDLVQAMHGKYAGRWYRSLTFVQRVIYADARPEQEWWEAMNVPGRLRIDMVPIDSGKGVVYRSDSLFRFAKGKLTGAGPGTNILLVLGFDVYGQPPARTVEILRDQHFDLGRLRADTWDGRAAWVVGADGNQFWVDRDRLVFLRVVQTGSNGVSSDIRFNRYEPLDGGWIAPEVVFLRDGKEFMREVYRDWRANPDLDHGLFQGPPFGRPAWVPRRK